MGIGWGYTRHPPRRGPAPDPPPFPPPWRARAPTPVPVPTPIPTPVPTPIPGPIPPSPGRVLYSNDLWNERTFRAGQNGGCSWGYADGGFVLGNVQASGWCYFDAGPSHYDSAVRIEVTSHLRAGPQEAGFGLKFGQASNGDYYIFQISANGGHKLLHFRATSADRRNGQLTDLYDWTNDNVVRRGYGAANRLAVEIQGTTIRTVLNGRRVGSAQAPGDVRGRIGFVVIRQKMEAVYKDLRVLSLP
jgi:hypothetical protein